MIKIVPSILTDSPQEAFEMVSKCEGVVDRVSIDIIDGKFANNKTVDPSVFEVFQTDVKLDFQLMVVEPINWIEKCARAGADRIIGHIEHMYNQTEFIGKVQEVGLSVGLGLDVDTPVDLIDSEILKDLDLILLMSVSAGFGGQDFDNRVLKKIEEMKKIREKDETPFKIHVDGGITPNLLSKLIPYGVDEVSIGRALFNGNISDNIREYLKYT